MTKRRIVIVCGYGCHIHSTYEEYLKRVTRYTNENPVDLIIVSGGFSQKKTAPDRSEAAVIASYLKPLVSVPIIEESESLTTNESLENALALLRPRAKPATYFLVIFCDAIRALKVKLIAERVFKDYDIQIETSDMSPKGASRKQLIASFEDILASYFPVINLIRRKIRGRRSQKI